jgi:magnesium-transporting ATPase (P-type)
LLRADVLSFNCRRIKNPSLGKGFFNNRYVFIATGALIILQLLFVYVPFMNKFFETSPIEGSYWIYPLGSRDIIFFIVVELEKFIVAKIRGRR